MRAAPIVFAVWLAAAPCLAQGQNQEPVGCDKFKWPLDNERAMLAADAPTVASGTNLSHPLPLAVIVSLVSLADAKLPAPPERAPKSPTSYAGFVQVAAPQAAGSYKVTLSSEAWIDVAQNGHFVKSTAFTSVTGCDGVRKSVKFDLAAQPITLELSGVPSNTIRMAVTGD